MIEFITIPVLVLSIVLHEVAHGHAANWLGDPTARLAGRLNLNPLLHIDPVGSIIVPGMLYITGAGFLFGWAKPVPYNPYNLRNQKWGEAFVAAAGPLTNLLLAILFAGVFHIAQSSGASREFLEITGDIVLINVLLALFNAIPIPPLDGSKVITPFLPFGLSYKYRAFTAYMESVGFLALLVFVFFFMYILSEPFSLLVNLVMNLLI